MDEFLVGCQYKSVEDKQHFQDKAGMGYTLVLSAIVGNENNHNGFCAKVTLEVDFRVHPIISWLTMQLQFFFHILEMQFLLSV